MVIGSYNLFEVGCQVDFCEIGSYNVFEHRVKIEANCKIGNGCIITAGVRLPTGTVIPDSTIVYGEGRMMKNLTMTEDAFKLNIKALAEVLAKSLQPSAMSHTSK